MNYNGQINKEVSLLANRNNQIPRPQSQGILLVDFNNKILV